MCTATGSGSDDRETVGEPTSRNYFIVLGKPKTMDDDLPGDRRPTWSPVASSLVSRLDASHEDRQRPGRDHPTRRA